MVIWEECILFCKYVCMCVHECGGQGITSFLPSCGSWESNSGPQDWYQAVLLTEPSILPAQEDVLICSNKY